MPNLQKDDFYGSSLVRIQIYEAVYKPDGSYTMRLYQDKAEPTKEVRKSVVRKGVLTPQYETRRKMGNLPVNPFEYENKFISYPKYASSWVSWYRNGLLGFSGTIDGPMKATSPIASLLTYGHVDRDLVASADREARSRALAEIKSQKVNLAQFWAERKQTINLIADSAAKIAGFLMALKKGDIIKAGKALGSRPSRRIRRNYRELKTQSVRDATADAWLAMQYGWKPLLSDVYGAVDMLVERASDIQRFMAKSKAVRSVEIPGSWYKGDNPNGVWNFKSTFKVTIKYTYMFDVTQSAFTQQVRLGLTNPLLLAWELVPYSFVVDWFLPIGNALSNLDATLGVTFSTGSKVVRMETNHFLEEGPDPRNSKQHFFRGEGSGYSKIVVVQRSRENAFPLPTMPELKNPLSVTHALNALALLSGAASRRKR